MKEIRMALSFLLTLAVLLALATPAIALQTASDQPYICETSEEFADCIIRMAGNNERQIKVSIPKTLPEADMDVLDMMTKVMGRDSGLIRWNWKGAGASRKIADDRVLLRIVLTYRATAEQNEIARKQAAAIVRKWDADKLSARSKMSRLKSYISTNLRYDNALKNITAQQTFAEKKGTCLGIVLASCMLLDEMGIPYQTVHGRYGQMSEIHIRLLVEIDGYWYVFDPTELARDDPNVSSYLKCDHGKYFVPDNEYLTEQFCSGHPFKPADK